MRARPFLDPLILARARMGGRGAQPSGVLLVSAGGLGDTILFGVVLPRFMELARPGETVTVLLRKDGARMSFVFPQGVQTLAVDFGQLRDVRYRIRMARQLYRGNYRMVVHTDYLRHPDLDEFLVAACAAPETAAMEPRPWRKYQKRLTANRRLYGRLFESGAAVADKVLRWCRFAAFLTGKDAPPPSVAVARPEPAVLDAPTVVLQPFSAVSLKHSPPALWRAIIGTLPPGWQVKLAGHPSDLDKNPDYRPLLDLPGVSFEGAPFKDLAAIIAGARLVVSVDTACMHLAAALGTPTLCLASAAYVGEIVPYDPAIMPPNLRVLYQPMDCQGCLGACVHPPKDGMYPCVAALDSDQVLAAIRSMTA